MTRRILFVRLPHFAVERFIKTSRLQHIQAKPFWDAPVETKAQGDEGSKNASIIKDGPIVLVQEGAKGTRISALGLEAAGEGLWCGMTLNDARAMVPNLRVEHHDVEADHTALIKMALWMQRYSPAVAIYDDGSIVLDTAGCDHLFGGEKAMAQDMEARLLAMGFTPKMALTDRLATCFALVTYGQRHLTILPKGHASDVLDTLPVEALRLDGDTVTLLKRLGLKQIGAVRPLPRAALERRFRDDNKRDTKTKSAGMAQSVQWRLDQLSGAISEPLNFMSEPQEFRVTRPCPELALEQGAVGIALEELLPKLCLQLEEAGKGARRFCLTGYRADGGSGSVAVNLSQPVRDAKIIKRLFRDRLDHIDCGFGIDLFVLEALGTEPYRTTQRGMIDLDHVHASSESTISSAIAAFADTITNKAGPRSVIRLAPHASHVPERAQISVDVTTPTHWNEFKTSQPVWSPRPLRLFERPEPARVTAELPHSPPVQFIWRRVLRKIVKSRGPERILPEWWHDSLKPNPGAAWRDYYDVEDENGLRYWLFRSMRLEQVEAAEDGDTSSKTTTALNAYWFVHGLF